MSSEKDEVKGRVTGLGGVFIKCRDPEGVRDWYRRHLGVPCDAYGATFPFREDGAPDRRGYTVWGPFKADTDYFAPSTRDFMINLRVDDLDAVLARLAADGIVPVGGIVDEPYGRFAWVIDPEGTKIELWQQIGEPPA